MAVRGPLELFSAGRWKPGVRRADAAPVVHGDGRLARAGKDLGLSLRPRLETEQPGLMRRREMNHVARIHDDAILQLALTEAVKCTQHGQRPGIEHNPRAGGWRRMQSNDDVARAHGHPENGTSNRGVE